MEETPIYLTSLSNSATMLPVTSSSPKMHVNSQPYQKPYIFMKITTSLDMDQEQLANLNKFIIQFSHLLSIKSEHMAVAKIYDKLNTQKELTSEDLDFLKGMLITLRDRYIRNKQIAQTQPQNYSSNITEYYYNSISELNIIIQIFE